MLIASRKSSPEIPIAWAKQRGWLRRLSHMQMQLRPLAWAIGRTVVLVALASLLILVLLPAAMAAQAATAT